MYWDMMKWEWEKSSHVKSAWNCLQNTYIQFQLNRKTFVTHFFGDGSGEGLETELPLQALSKLSPAASSIGPNNGYWDRRFFKLELP